VVVEKKLREKSFLRSAKELRFVARSMDTNGENAQRLKSSFSLAEPVAVGE